MPFRQTFYSANNDLLLVILRGKIWYENLLWNQLKCSALKIYNTQHCSYWEKKRLLGSILAQYVLLKFVSRLRLCSLQGLSLEMLASWKHAIALNLPSRLICLSVSLFHRRNKFPLQKLVYNKQFLLPLLQILDVENEVCVALRGSGWSKRGIQPSGQHWMVQAKPQ